MKPLEYEKNVLITESNNFEAIKGRTSDQMIRLLHAGLGLSSELAELNDAYADPKGANQEIDWVNVTEEAADMAWYTAIAINALGLNHDIISVGESTEELGDLKKYDRLYLGGVMAAAAYAIGNYNDLLKKSLFYGRALDVTKVEKTLKQLCMSLAGICFVAGSSIEEARERNIKKLKARYGEKFTESAALNRDLETERKILEGNES